MYTMYREYIAIDLKDCFDLLYLRKILKSLLVLVGQRLENDPSLFVNNVDKKFLRIYVSNTRIQTSILLYYLLL